MQFGGLPETGSPLSLQHSLAVEVLAAEYKSREKRSEILARHKRLVRIIGDSLASSVLNEHTIRTLGRHPGSPASLVGQADDFAFVEDVAGKLAASGYTPILCDLTNLLRVGDIVAVTADHVLVLECKRSPLPNRLPKTGRLARQRARGNQAASYLANSRVVEPGGVERQALSFAMPEPRWDMLANLADQLSPGVSSSAMTMLDDGDALALTTTDADIGAILAGLHDAVSGGTPVLGCHLDIVREPRWNCPSPLLFPVPSWLQHALLECDTLMFRLVDLDRFITSSTTPSGQLAKTTIRAAHGISLSMAINNEIHDFGPSFLDRVMYTPTTLVDTRDALLSCADMLYAPIAISTDQHADFTVQTADKIQAQLANGDDVTYGTVYLSTEGDRPVVVYDIRDGDDEAHRHIAWDPGENETIAYFVNGVRQDSKGNRQPGLPDRSLLCDSKDSI